MTSNFLTLSKYRVRLYTFLYNNLTNKNVFKYFTLVLTIYYLPYLDNRYIFKMHKSLRT